MSIASTLITAAEFARMPDPGHPQELFRGVVVNIPPPKLLHGHICGQIIFLLKTHAVANRLGRVFGNDSGIITEQDPDTVRGADVSFISYAKLPQNASLNCYLTIAPDAVFEVLSLSDRWRDVLKKVSEYLLLGTPAVYVVDPDRTEVRCYFPDRAEEILSATDEFSGIGPLADFRVPVAKFFE